MSDKTLEEHLRHSVRKLEYRVDTLYKHLFEMVHAHGSSLGKEADALLIKLEDTAVRIQDAVKCGKTGPLGVLFAASEISDITSDLRSVKFYTDNRYAVSIVFILAEDIANDLDDLARNMIKEEQGRNSELKEDIKKLNDKIDHIRR